MCDNQINAACMERCPVIKKIQSGQDDSGPTLSQESQDYLLTYAGECTALPLERPRFHIAGEIVEVCTNSGLKSQYRAVQLGALVRAVAEELNSL